MRLANASPAPFVNRHRTPATGVRRAVAAVMTIVTGAALVACAQAATPVTATPASSAPAASPTTSPEGVHVGLRVQVQTVTDWPSLPALAARLAAIAGVPVRDIAGIAPQRVSVTLECADTTACDRAVARLAAERAVIAEVTPDARRKLPTRPPRSESK